MDEEATLLAVNQSANTSVNPSSSNVEEVGAANTSTSINESININSTLVLQSNVENNEKDIDLSSENSTLQTFATSDVSGITGFDSADSTNDADFLTTRKAVLSAIDLMDEGLKDEEETSAGKIIASGSGTIILSSNDHSETIGKTSCSDKNSESNAVVSKINNEPTTASDKNSNSSFIHVGLEKVCESPRNVDSGITKDSRPISENSVEESYNKEIENDECPKEKTSIDDISVDTLDKESVTPETKQDTINELNREEQFGIKNVIVSINDSEIGSDQTIDKESDINRSCQIHVEKDLEKFSVENTPVESIKSSNKKNVEEGADDISMDILGTRENPSSSVSEDLVKDSISESKNCERTELEECSSTLDVIIEKKTKLDDSDDVIVLDEIHSSGNLEKNEAEPALPVSIEIADVEISVFKYEKNNKHKEFKLDDMVLSSDEDSDCDGLEDMKRQSQNVSNIARDILNSTPDIPNMAESNTASITEKAVNTNCLEPKDMSEPQTSKDNKADIEVMDDSSDIQKTCNLKDQEDNKMDLEDCDDSSYRKVSSSKLSDSDCLSNEGSDQRSPKAENMEISRSPGTSNCKNHEDVKMLDPESICRKDNDTEIANTSKNTDNKDDSNMETDLENMLKEALAKNEKFRENLSEDSIQNDSKKLSGSTSANVAEVISLVDDEDEVTEKKKPAAAVNCVNPNCMSGEDLAPPAMFVLSYFAMKRSKGQQVCAECFNTVVRHQEVLSSLLTEGKPMFSAKFPSHKDVILLDSDEESLSDNESNLSDDTMSMIRDNLDDVICETLTKFDFDFQLQESCNILDSKISKLEKEASEITERFDTVQHSLDEFRKLMYDDFQPESREKEEVHFMECEIPPMPIVKSKLQNQLYNKELMNRLRKSHQEREIREVEQEQNAVPIRTIATKRVSHTPAPQISGDNTTQDVTFVRSEAKCVPPTNLPPPGPLVRYKLRVGDLAYTMKVSYFSIWVQCRVVEIIPRNPTENDPSTETYRVRLENVKKNSVRTVTGKYLAYNAPARVELSVGVRVIAIFKEEDDSATKDNYYVGVIAEPPKSTNKYRYLVFFDDGYTQYCPHENVLVVCATSKNVWEDIHPEPRDFIRNYIQQYPERPMVKLSRGQVVKVEWNGRWWIVRVLEVDGSLVKVHFDADRRTEWIYRGSTRLGPMYQELAAAKERQHGSLLRSRGFGGGAHHKSDMPYVEYTRGDSEGDGENKQQEKEKTEEPPVAPRSVARKSTAKKPVEPVISNTNYSQPLISQLPDGQVRQRRLRPKFRPLRFRPHQCSSACVSWTGYTPAIGNKFDPLVKPLMYGFERLLGNFKGKTVVHYRAPCGRTLRSHQEMFRYLRSTRSQLTTDLFDFDFWVNPLSEFEEGSTFGKIEDLSYGKENIRISCVNELDHSMPQYVQYMTARQPAKDVHLNLDPEFLVGCDCEDDCEDRSKCSCWQLTMQGKAYVPDGDLDPLFGYQHRRLPERIATGIYECNSRCKCSMTCQNRVAQQPLSCRLQLFKTLKKGWGIRCHHDIPRGAFICIYAGFLLTEQEANEGGKTYGDEYLAELDYIESVENLKEGYESEAKEPSDIDDDDSSQKDTMDIEYDNSADSDAEEEELPRRPGDIRLRLRRRTADEAEKESRKSKTEDDAISISDEEIDAVRKPKTFDANITVNNSDDADSKYPSVRELYGPDENVYIMDAKTHGNIGRYLNHSCSPNVFVQNVFVDTHDLRFPWVAFFANQYIPAGTELTWDYNYDVGSVPGKVMLCYCGTNHCRGRLL